MPDRRVDITESGRGGSIYYREGANVAAFDWEFAVPPAIALIVGPGAQAWNGAYPWAAGRQAEVFAFVGAEVVRQKAAGHITQVDLEAGTLSVLQKPARRPRGTRTRSRGAKAAADRSPAYARFLSSMVPAWEHWREDQGYDVAAIAEMSPGERAALVPMLTERDVTWREVEALAAIDTPAARAAVEAASRHHLSIDTRLAAAEVMRRAAHTADFDLFLARQIRRLDRPANGLARALLLAERHPTDVVKQALLWASYNQTDCAPHCARLLLILTGAGKEPFDPPTQEMLRQLGVHNSSFTRQAAFDQLCRVVNMQLDQAPAD